MLWAVTHQRVLRSCERQNQAFFYDKRISAVSASRMKVAYAAASRVGVCQGMEFEVMGA